MINALGAVSCFVTFLYLGVEVQPEVFSGSNFRFDRRAEGAWTAGNQKNPLKTFDLRCDWGDNGNVWASTASMTKIVIAQDKEKLKSENERLKMELSKAPWAVLGLPK